MSSKWTIIVVCDGGNCETIVDTVKLSTDQLGFSGAVNVGIRHAQRLGFSAVIVLNDDAVPEEGCLEGLALAVGPSMGLYGPAVVEDGQVILGYHRSALGHFRTAKSPNEVHYLPAVCLLMPSWARFDEGYVHGFEDFELCRRFHQMNLPVQVMTALRCDHQGGATCNRKSSAAQYGSCFGQLRFEGLCRSPLVLAYQIAQIAREGFRPNRFKAVSRAVIDYCWLRATAMASPKAGSIRAK
ncbi:MAG: glycosyltransferase family 2 protein [Myxococcota bacterium]